MTLGKLTTLAATAALFFLACGARTLIGMVPDGSAPDGGSPPRTDAVAADVAPGTEGHTCTPVTIPDDGPYTLPAGVAGTWTGYFQGGSPVQSDAVKLVIQTQADGSGSIRVTTGSGTPPPPPTNATDYYPPGAPSDLAANSPHLIEGVTYLAHAVTWQGTRLKFVVAQTEPWGTWCALQTSYFVSDTGRYSCMPGSGAYTSQADGGTVCVAVDVESTKETPVSCAQFSQCFNGKFCTCDSCGCSAAPADTNGADAAGYVNTSGFDLTFDGDLLTGVGAGYNVRLTRTAP